MDAGFSGAIRAIDIEVGHVSGLRWVSLDVSRCHDPNPTVTASDGRGRLAPHVTCTCGSSASQLDPGFTTWMGIHAGRSAGPPVLSGVYGPWVPGENVAACKTAGLILPLHRSPELGSECHCGFWAYWALGAKAVRRNPVVALVNGYGYVLDGDKGWRSSHAAIEALCVPSPDPGLQNSVESRYGVPVYSTVAAMLGMHPAPEGQPPLSDGGWSADLSERAGYYDPYSPYSGPPAYIAHMVVPAQGGFMYYTGGAGRSSGGGGSGSSARVSGGGGGSGGGVASSAAGLAAKMEKLSEQVKDVGRHIRGLHASFAVADEMTAGKDPVKLTGEDAAKVLHDRREKWAGFKSAATQASVEPADIVKPPSA